jgi:hypothetical protein
MAKPDIFRLLSAAALLCLTIALCLGVHIDRSTIELVDPRTRLIRRSSVTSDGELAAVEPVHGCAFIGRNDSESEVLDCYPYDVASADVCWARGCCWRPTASGGPWCIPPFAPVPAASRCTSVPLPLRVDCHPEPEASPGSCAARGCCWTPLHDSERGSNAPWCHYPALVDYRVESVESPSDARGGHFVQHLRLHSGRGAFGQAPPALLATTEVISTLTKCAACGAVRLRVHDEMSAPRWSFADIVGGPAASQGFEAGTLPVPATLRVTPASTGEPFSLRVSRLSESRAAGGSTPADVTVSGPLSFEPQFVQVGVECGVVATLTHMCVSV